MIQIIQEKRKPTGLERFGQIFGAGLKGAAEGFAPQIEAKQQKKALADKLEMFEKPEFKHLFANVDPRLAGIAKMAAAGLIDPGVATSMAELVRQGQSDIDFKNAIMGVGGQGEPSKVATMPNAENIPSEEGILGGKRNVIPEQESQPKHAAPKRDYNKEISDWQSTLPSAKTAQQKAFVESQIKELQSLRDIEFKGKESEQKHKHQTAQMEYQEAKPTIEYANDLALSLLNEEQVLDSIDIALKNKDFGFFSRDNIAEMTGFEKLRSPEGALLKSGIKEYFLSDVKGIGGKGLNQWLEKQLNDAMLKIGRDNAANEIVKVGFDARYDRKKAWLDEYRKLYKQQKSSQGYVAGDIGQQVAENLKPYYEARQKQLEAEIKAIQKSGQSLSGRMVDVTDPNGEIWEIDESQVGELPEGWLLK